MRVASLEWLEFNAVSCNCGIFFPSLLNVLLCDEMPNTLF